MRREAQLILSQLYLGPFQAATNAETMHRQGITHVSVLASLHTPLLALRLSRLCVREHRERAIIFPRFPDQFAYMTLELFDNEVRFFDRSLVAQRLTAAGSESDPQPAGVLDVHTLRHRGTRHRARA